MSEKTNIATLDYLNEYDPEIGNAMTDELKRQRRNLELIASENIVSPAVMAAMGSLLTNKYAEGYPGKRYYGGCQCVDVVEEVARKRACELFGAEHANVQPHSGAQANTAVYFAMLNPGDTVMGMNLTEGGHLTHGSPVNISGKYFNFVPYGVDPETHRIDYDKVLEIAKECKPKMIVAGASAYPRIIDFAKLREIADAVGAYLMVDMAHIAGLVAAGVHPSPFPYADVVTSTTHKTLRGPRGGIILTNDEEIIKKVNKTIFPGIQGGPLEHVIAAKCQCFYEAMSDEFKSYAKNVITNAKVLSETLKEEGFKIVSSGTDNHMFLLNVKSIGVTGKMAEDILEKINITVNKNMVPGDTEKAGITSGIRLGSAALTTRGLNTDDFKEIGLIISKALKNYNDENILNELKLRVKNITDKYPLWY